MRFIGIMSAVALAGTGCGPRGPLAPKPHRDQTALGRAVYLAHCAKCHGANGEGATGRTLVAPWDPLAGYRTADQLYDFVSRIMPFDDPGRLKAQEYWDVIAFLLNANGVLPSGAHVGPDNAGSIKTAK
jgi:polar amino acid transport system substrate-binding protein